MIELLLSIPNGYWIFGLLIVTAWLTTVLGETPENENGVAKGLVVLIWMGFVIMVIATHPLMTN